MMMKEGFFTAGKFRFFVQLIPEEYFRLLD